MNNKKYRILVVDSDEESLSATVSILKEEDFNVCKSTSSDKVLLLAQKNRPHMVLLELDMPCMDGIEVCVELKRDPLLQNILVVFYTIRDDDYSQIAAFSAGADDYIIKPKKKNVLISRINAILKRYNKGAEEDDTSIANVSPNQTNGKIQIDQESYLVTKDNQKIIFPRKEFELLALLASVSQKVFSRKEIADIIWNQNIHPDNRTIDVHIRRLRKKLGDDSIKTIKGLGYRLEI